MASDNDNIPNTGYDPKKEYPVLQVLVIGAGFSGICAGIKLLEKGITNFRIYEKSDEIGGTWYDNVYPGAACDVPSHLYCFSFEMNPNWSRLYSPQEEIKDYIEKCADKYGIFPYIETGRRILKLQFLDEEKLWLTYFDDGQIVKARHIINGAGGLHEPLVPEFKGSDEFSGVTMHAARWNKNVEFAGKNIAVIGSAASAIQLIPELAKIASSLKIFQRTPNYIARRNDYAYSEKWKKRFARWPWLLNLYRQFIFYQLEFLLFPVIKKNSIWGKIVGKRILQHPRKVVKDRELRKKLIPDYDLGCKRILVSDNFYQTLNKDNVEMVTKGIDGFYKDGIVAQDATQYSCDIVVYATGYDIEKHLLSIKIYGENGRSLEEEWSDIPTAYNGLCISGFPNYFMVTGPNTGVGTTSVVFMIEQQMAAIIRLIGATGDMKTISVKSDKQKKYNQKIQEELGNTVWASSCNSWYRQSGGANDGAISTLFPSHARDFRKQQKNIDLGDFHIK